MNTEQIKTQQKTVVITGGNTGIGLATATQIAQQGHRVIIACRNQTKAEEAIASIAGQIGNGSIEYQHLDLASFDSINTFADSFLKSESTIDVLINNAGAYPTQQSYTQEGFELQFGVNYLGHFLLTQLLLPVIKKASDARIVHVSSIMHALGKIDFDTFKGRPKYSGTAAYAQSKLANLMFSNELSEKLKQQADTAHITSNAMHPGGVDSDIYRDMPKAFHAVLRNFLITTERAGKYIADMALSPSWKERTGEFVVAHGPRYVSRRSKNKAVSQKLYEQSQELTMCDTCL